MNIFQRASANLPLTPVERASLKFLQSLILTALIAGLLTAAQYLQGNGSINWHELLIAVAGAMGLAIFHAIAKYFTSQAGTAILGASIETFADEIAKRLPGQNAQSAAEKADTPAM